MSNIQNKFLVLLTAVAACFTWSAEASAQDSNLISRAVSLTQTGGPLFQSIGNMTAANIQAIGSSYADQVSVAVANGNQTRIDALLKEFQSMAAGEAREGLREGLDNITEMTHKMDRLMRAASLPETVVQIELYRGILISAHDTARAQIRSAFNSARNDVANAANGN